MARRKEQPRPQESGTSDWQGPPADPAVPEEPALADLPERHAVDAEDEER